MLLVDNNILANFIWIGHPLNVLLEVRIIPESSNFTLLPALSNRPIFISFKHAKILTCN